MARISIAPGGTTGWHTHPGPVLAAVHSGTITIVNATFLEVPPDGKATIPADDPGTCDL